MLFINKHDLRNIIFLNKNIYILNIIYKNIEKKNRIGEKNVYCM